MGRLKKILVCPLDWGLGHATRCIPVINKLLEHDCEVHIAGNGKSLKLLRITFPHLKWYAIPGWRIRYADKPFFFLFLFFQLPFFIFSVFRENYLVKRIQKKEGFHVIISDNRYGLFTRLTKTVFICHQLKIILPGWLKLFEKIAHWLTSRVVSRYDICWIPDMPGSPCSGILSAAGADSGNARYTGLLSRFSDAEATTNEKSDYEIVAVLSGPEPSRSRFEKILEKQLSMSKRKSLLIRGLPDNQSISQNGNFYKVNHLSANAFSEVVQNARYIICRSGYSGIMDLLVLKKRAILVPTPGQTEQEYLARHLRAQGLFPFMKQEEFELEKALELLDASMNELPEFQGDVLLEEAVRSLLESD